MFWNWKGYERKGRVWISGSPLSGRGRLFSFISIQCLDYVTSSQVWFWHFVNIFEFHFWRCDEWDEFDHIWFCRRQCKYHRGSPAPVPSHLIVPESQLCGESPSGCTLSWFAAELSEIYAGHTRCEGAPPHTCPPCLLVTRADHWVAAKMG